MPPHVRTTSPGAKVAVESGEVGDRDLDPNPVTGPEYLTRRNQVDEGRLKRDGIDGSGVATLMKDAGGRTSDDQQTCGPGSPPKTLRLSCRACERDGAEQRPYRLLVHCSGAAVPELSRRARTMDALREALLAPFDTGGLSDGPREAMDC